MLIDTHIHLDRFSAELDLEKELIAARKSGVARFVVPGVHRCDWPRLKKMVASIDGGLAAYGVHPLAGEEWDQSCGDELQNFLRDEKAVAVGEIGLDRYVDVVREVQERVFREQLQIAVAEGLPVLIHCRRRTGRILEILQEEKIHRVGGIMHAFGGSYETARKAISLGFVLSFGGSLTYPEARRVVEVLQKAPGDAIVIETDAPDMAPHPHRGCANRPLWLNLVLERLAEIRGWSLEQAAAMTTRNARRALKLDER